MFHPLLYISYLLISLWIQTGLQLHDGFCLFRSLIQFSLRLCFLLFFFTLFQRTLELRDVLQDFSISLFLLFHYWSEILLSICVLLKLSFFFTIFSISFYTVVFFHSLSFPSLVHYVTLFFSSLSFSHCSVSKTKMFLHVALPSSLTGHCIPFFSSLPCLFFIFPHCFFSSPPASFYFRVLFPFVYIVSDIWTFSFQTQGHFFFLYKMSEQFE